MAAVCGTSGIASLFSRAAFAAESDIADGKTVRFDFSVLQSMAHDLAQKPWGGAPRVTGHAGETDAAGLQQHSI